MVSLFFYTVYCLTSLFCAYFFILQKSLHLIKAEMHATRILILHPCKDGPGYRCVPHARLLCKHAGQITCTKFQKLWPVAQCWGLLWDHWSWICKSECLQKLQVEELEVLKYSRDFPEQQACQDTYCMNTVHTTVRKVLQIFMQAEITCAKTKRERHHVNMDHDPGILFCEIQSWQIQVLYL